VIKKENFRLSLTGEYYRSKCSICKNKRLCYVWENRKFVCRRCRDNMLNK